MQKITAILAVILHNKYTIYIMVNLRAKDSPHFLLIFNVPICLIKKIRLLLRAKSLNSN